MLGKNAAGARLRPVHGAQANQACDDACECAARTSSRGAQRGASAWLQSRARRLRRLLGGRLRMVGTGRDLRIVVDEALPATAAAMLPSTSGKTGTPEPPALRADELACVRSDLATILDQHPAARALWPSLALIERGLRKHGGASVARMSAAVVRDAAKVLGRLVGDWGAPGLVALHEHVVLVLRTLHGEDPPHDPIRVERCFEIQVKDGSMTDFMTIDRLWDQRLAQES